MSKQFYLYKERHIRKSKIIIFLLITTMFVLSVNNALAESKNVNPYQGNISGEWSGNIQGAPVSGTFLIKISADGVLSGSLYATGESPGSKPSAITGSVSSEGNFKADSDGGITDWKWEGTLFVSKGRISGNGLFTGSGSSGSWSVK